MHYFIQMNDIGRSAEGLLLRNNRQIHISKKMIVTFSDILKHKIGNASISRVP